MHDASSIIIATIIEIEIQIFIKWFKTYIYSFISTIKKKRFYLDIIYLINKNALLCFYYLILYTINNEKIMKIIILDQLETSLMSWKGDVFSLKQCTTMYIFNKQKLLPFDWDVLFHSTYSSNLAICFLLVLYIEKFS